MKKIFKRITGIIIASSIIVSNAFVNIIPVSAAESWIKGFTGSESSNDYQINTLGSSVQLVNTKVNNGKFSDGEDSFIYYGTKKSADTDFEFAATVNIDELNKMEGSSNPQQGSVGIGVIDELYNKTDDKTYTNGVYLGTWAKDKNADMAFYPITRDSSDKKTIGEAALSETFVNTGENLGAFDLSIQKSGNTYTLKCGDKTSTVELKSFEGDIYPCIYIARNVKATFSNIRITEDTKKIVQLIADGQPKDKYYYGDELDLTGLTVTAVYDDNTESVITDYFIKGFNSKKPGEQTVTLSKGNAEYSFNINVYNVKCTDINIVYPPAKTDYHIGSVFRAKGISVIAEYENGTKEELAEELYTFKIDDKPIKDGDIIKDSLTGEKTVKVFRNDSEGIDGGTAFGTFKINVSSTPLYGIEITSAPEKLQYTLNDKLDLKGLKVSAVFDDGEKELLSPDEYTVTELYSDLPGEKTITVSYKQDPETYSQFRVYVDERKPEGIKIISYPRTTYNVNEDFSTKGMVVGIYYDNGDVEETKDYTVDTSKYNSSIEGEGLARVTIVPNNTTFSPITLKISIKKAEEHKWRKSIFGQSANTDKEKEGISGVKAENYGTTDGTINVRAWEGTGKITADHDGIVYYYTSLNTENNFTISADIKVNKYLEHDNDDTKRSGQEAFGIMARDVVPLKKEDGSRTIYSSEAVTDSEGVPVPHEQAAVFASNVVIAGGYSGSGWPSDKDAPNYEKQINLNRINLFVRKGVDAIDGGGTKVGPSAISNHFPSEGNTYRITLSKVNGGFYAKCYDYQTEETKDTYIFEEDILKQQNKDEMYVGFFAARWADIDVNNVEFYESVPSSDPIVENDNPSPLIPDIQINSGKYSKAQNYTLTIEPVNTSGTVTVKQDNTVIVKDKHINTGETKIETALNENKENVFTVSFTPDDTQNLTSYETIITRQTVLNKTFDYNTPIVYVSNNGKYNGDGTKENPYDIDTAIGFLAPGQTIMLMEGVYSRTEPIIIEEGNNGRENAMKTITVEKEGSVVFDFNNVSAGAVVSGNYWHIKGIEFKNSGPNLKCFHLGGSNCIIEECIFHDNGDIGLQISRTNQENSIDKWPSNNLILRCESYNNCDPSMINADGFGAKLTVGNGNIFRECSSHHNVDDGWDLYTKVNSGPIGAVTIENCVTYKNGYKLLEDGTEQPYKSGGHNGFKLGGENVGVQHVLINCIAYENEGNGFTTNSNPMLKLTNCISYGNEEANYRIYSDKPQEYNYDFTDCVSYDGGMSEILGTVTQQTEYTNASENPIINNTNYFINSDGKSVNASGKEFTETDLQSRIEKLKSNNQ